MRGHIVSAVVGLVCLLTSAGSYAFQTFQSAAACVPGLRPNIAGDLRQLHFNPYWGWVNDSTTDDLYLFCPIPYGISTLDDINGKEIKVDVYHGKNAPANITAEIRVIKKDGSTVDQALKAVNVSSPGNYVRINLNDIGGTPVPSAHVNDFVFIRVRLPKRSVDPSILRGIFFGV
jgi:hypothetical protein